MVKIRKQYTHNFTLIDNGILDNEKLSWKAKGLFCYLWRQPDDWEYYESEVVKHSTDGIAALKSGLKELEEAGYLHRERAREKGQLKGTIWNLTEHPTKKPPMLENPMLEKPMLEKPTLENQTLPSTNLTNTNNTKYEEDNDAFSNSTELADRREAIDILETIHAAPNAIQKPNFNAAENKYGKAFMKAVALVVAQAGAERYTYFKKTLNAYIKKGITTPEGVRKEVERHEKLVDDFQSRKEEYLKNGYRQGQTNYQATGAVDFLDPRRLDEM